MRSKKLSLSVRLVILQAFEFSQFSLRSFSNFHTCHWQNVLNISPLFLFGRQNFNECSEHFEFLRDECSAKSSKFLTSLRNSFALIVGKQDSRLKKKKSKTIRKFISYQNLRTNFKEVYANYYILLINREWGHYREISDRGLDVLTER